MFFGEFHEGLTVKTMDENLAFEMDRAQLSSMVNNLIKVNSVARLESQMVYNPSSINKEEVEDFIFKTPLFTQPIPKNSVGEYLDKSWVNPCQYKPTLKHPSMTKILCFVIVLKCSQRFILTLSPFVLLL